MAQWLSQISSNATHPSYIWLGALHLATIIYARFAAGLSVGLMVLNDIPEVVALEETACCHRTPNGVGKHMHATYALG